jgi:hydrogenase expression/formation protein HypC
MSELEGRGAAWTEDPSEPKGRAAAWTKERRRSDEGRQRLESAPEASGRYCHDEVCITCSDSAVEVRVLRLLADELAMVDTGAGEEEVSVALVTARVGDTILVHAREAIAVVGR